MLSAARISWSKVVMSYNRSLRFLAFAVALSAPSLVVDVAAAAGQSKAAASAARAKTAAADGLPTEVDIATQARVVFDELAGNADPRVRMAVYEGRLALGKEDRSKAVAAGVEDAFTPLRKRALLAALADKDKKVRELSLASLAKGLASGEAGEREFAAEIVVDSSSGLKPLEINAQFRKATVDGGPETRTWARAQIIRLGGKPGWEVLAALLAEPADSKEFAEGLKRLADYKEGLGATWALTHLHDRDQLGAAARAYLAQISDSKAAGEVVKSLNKIYDKAEFAQRVDAAAVLSVRGAGTPAIAKSLSKGARFTDPAVRLVSLWGLRGVRDAAVLSEMRERVSTNETEGETALAFEWLTTWAKATGDAKVIELLQEIAKSDRRSLRLNALDALSQVAHRPSVALFEAAMKEGQTEIRQAAARGLAAVARPGDEKRLAEYLRKEPVLEVKLALIRAFAAIGTPEILDPLQFVITAPQVEIKRAVVEAVAPTGTSKAASLIGLLKRDADLETRFLAWQFYLRLDPKAASKELKATIGWLSAAQALTLAQDPKIGADALEILALEGSDDHRTAAVKGLASRGDSSATRLLSISDRSQNEDAAAAALAALAAVRGSASVPTYREGTKSRFPLVRAASYAALGQHGPRQVIDFVLPAVSDREPLVRAEAAVAAVRLSQKKPEAL